MWAFHLSRCQSNSGGARPPSVHTNYKSSLKTTTCEISIGNNPIEFQFDKHATFKQSPILDNHE